MDKVAADDARKAHQVRREAASALKNAKLAERQRSLRQQKMDDQERKRQHLKRRIIESAEEAARKEVDEIRKHAAAEAHTVKTKAKAKAKALRSDALRLRGSMLAAAKQEVQQMREQAMQEVEQLTCVSLRCTPETDDLESREAPQAQDAVVALQSGSLEHGHAGADGKQDAHGDEDDSAFESACEWEVLKELTTEVDEEEDSWVIG